MKCQALADYHHLQLINLIFLELSYLLVVVKEAASEVDAQTLTDLHHEGFTRTIEHFLRFKHRG